MIVKALDWIKAHVPPTLFDVNGVKFSDRRLIQISVDRFYPEDAYSLHTLTSLVEYFKRNPDELEFSKIIVHVASPTSVTIESTLDDRMNRSRFINTIYDENGFTFGKYYDQEEFIITLATQMVREESDIEAVIKYSSIAKIENVQSSEDDGTKQEFTAKSGISLNKQVRIPNPVVLQPYRTFREVEQPRSSFIFRARQAEKDGPVKFALFECDGGAWKLEAVKSILAYLIQGLPKEITVIG